MKVIGNKMVVLKYIVHKCACAEQMQKHQPFGWLKGDKCFYNIVSVSNIDVSMANVSGDIVTLDFSDVMEDNTFADGVPFGVKIEQNYNGIKIDEFVDNGG